MSDILKVTVTPLELQLHPGEEIQAVVAVQKVRLQARGETDIAEHIRSVGAEGREVTSDGE